jgi:hypothetical protein
VSALELQLKISVILAELKTLQGTCSAAGAAMREAAEEITRLRAENELLRGRARIADHERADFDLSADELPQWPQVSIPALLRPQAE